MFWGEEGSVITSNNLSNNDNTKASKIRTEPSLFFFHFRLQSKFKNEMKEKEDEEEENDNGRGTTWFPLVILKTMIAVLRFGQYFKFSNNYNAIASGTLREVGLRCIARITRFICDVCEKKKGQRNMGMK